MDDGQCCSWIWEDKMKQNSNRLSFTHCEVGRICSGTIYVCRYTKARDWNINPLHSSWIIFSIVIYELKITKPILRTRKKISKSIRFILKYLNNRVNIQTKTLYLLWNPGINNVVDSSAQRRSTPRKENSSTTKPSLSHFHAF